MDYSRKEEGGDNKPDCQGHESIHKTSPASLETVFDTGIEPVIGEDIGRPKKPYDSKEAQIVVLAYARYRFGARMLEVAIRKIYKTCISHNRIHMYLKASGLAQDDQNKKKRRKWVRYEQKHSLSAGHIDWHEWDGTRIKVCVILDDASRMILAGGEFDTINTKNSKKSLIRW